MPALDREKLQHGTFLTLFVLGAYLFWRTLEPIWIPVFLGGTIAVSIYPLQERLLNGRLRAHPGLPAAALTALVLVLIVALVGFLVFTVGERVLVVMKQVAERYQRKGTTGIFGDDVLRLLDRVGIDSATVHRRVGELTGEIAGVLGKSATAIVTGTFSLIFVLIFTALTSYYLLVEGKDGTSWLVEVLPLPDRQVRELLRNVRDVTRAMLLGTGVTALYQGVIAGVGYWIFGVDAPLVWAALTGAASILPGIGTALVWVPVSIVTMIHHLGRGIGLAAWGAVAVVFVADYILRPKLVGTKMRMNDLLVFIAIFGGIEAFGILGIVMGPIGVAFFLALIRIYQRDYRPGGPPAAPDVRAPEKVV